MLFRSGPLWLIAPRFFYHEIYFFQRRLWKKYELLEWFLSRLVVAGLIYSACRFDFLTYFANYWFAPALVVGVALGLFFDYLPHRPFKEKNRWKNARVYRSEEHTSELQSLTNLVCRLLLEKKKKKNIQKQGRNWASPNTRIEKHP